MLAFIDIFELARKNLAKIPQSHSHVVFLWDEEKLSFLKRCWISNGICRNIIERNKGIVKRAYWIISNSSIIQYCDSNIGLFSIAPPLVIALPTLR